MCAVALSSSSQYWQRLYISAFYYYPTEPHTPAVIVAPHLMRYVWLLCEHKERHISLYSCHICNIEPDGLCLRKPSLYLRSTLPQNRHKGSPCMASQWTSSMVLVTINTTRTYHARTPKRNKCRPTTLLSVMLTKILFHHILYILYSAYHVHMLNLALLHIHQ